MFLKSKRTFKVSEQNHFKVYRDAVRAAAEVLHREVAERKNRTAKAVPR